MILPHLPLLSEAVEVCLSECLSELFALFGQGCCVPYTADSLIANGRPEVLVSPTAPSSPQANLELFVLVPLFHTFSPSFTLFHPRALHVTSLS